MGAGRNIGGGAGGEAPGSKRVLGNQTEIFTHLEGLEIIISLNKKFHGILSFIENFISNISTYTTSTVFSINLTDSSYKTIKTERANGVLSWTQTRI